ncbi:MAG: hypothetical protein LC742_09470 [Acidobacteria bacterium]|nr:hypothetical protein [Acidobacteriota bacterium]
MSATLDKIIEEVKALPPDERRQLRDQLDALLVEPQPATTEDEFARHLADRLDALTDEERVKIIRQLVPRLVVSPRGDGRVRVSATYAFAPPRHT